MTPLLEELRSYVGLTDEDIETLARFRPLAEPHFAAIADEFYAIVRMHEGAFDVLKDEAQAQRLHTSLQAWLGELLGGPFDAKFVERHARIGRVHVQVGLQLRYVVTAMSRIRVSLQRIAFERLPDGAASDARLAIERVCDLDLAIMLESYKDDFVGRVERAKAVESEAVRQRLDARRRLYSDALDAADVAVLAFDAQGALALANRKSEHLTGWTMDDLAEGGPFELLFGDRAKSMREVWLGAVGESPVEIETDVRTRAGKTRIVRWHASSHRRPDGESMLIAVGVDVTHERELERRARQNERLAAAGALAAGLAHEIRNPLNGASLHVAVLDRALARTDRVPPAAREAADVLRGEIKRLGSLVTDFLEVARPKPLARVECDANEVANSVSALLRPEAAARKVSFSVDLFPFPASAHLDVERIKQVLVNLVRNAIEAVGEGGHVAMRVRRLPRHVEIDVMDDGPGIPDPDTPIFDAFFTTKERGTGLGLSIVHRIVTDHGGDVTFTSRPGSTVFTVTLPSDVPPTSTLARH